MNSIDGQAPSTRRTGVLRISGPRTEPVLSGRVDPESSVSGATYDLDSQFLLSFSNVRGLSSNFASVEHYLLSSMPNILFLTETQVSADVSVDTFSIPNYTLFPLFRFKGGVCAYAHSSTPVTRLSHFESHNFDALWLKLVISSGPKFICCVYRSPNSNNYSDFFDYLTLQFESIITHNPEAEVIFLGDFNVHHSDWLHSLNTDPQGEVAYRFSVYNDLEQLIQHPTRVPDQHAQTPQTLDLFLSTDISSYSYSISAPLGSSDHNLISVCCPALPPSPIRKPSHRLWHYRSADWLNLRNFYLDFPWNEYCFSANDTSVCADKVSEVIMAGMEAYIPFSHYSSSKSKPWFDSTCSEAISQRDEAFRSWQQDKSEANHSSYIASRNRAKATLRKAKHNFLKKKCGELSASTSDNSLWSLAKNLSHNFCKSSFPPLFDSDGFIATCPKEKANLFGRLFSANSTLNTSNLTPPIKSELSNPMPQFFISSKLVRKFLKALKVKKAHGPDGVPPRVLRECADELAPTLAHLFRRCMSSRMFPASWKHALVHPIPKKGDRSNPSNYRPIALTSSISKLFESILNTQILKHLERCKKLSDHQYGFRKARSTGDLLSYVTHLWSTSLRDHGESFVVALDISKAFDRVWHEALLAKLPSFGIPPSLCDLITSFLSDRSIAVVVDGYVSSSFRTNSGVPQGSVLSPTLFLLFINDLLVSTSNAVHSYADDSTLHSSSHFAHRPSSVALEESRLQQTHSLFSDLEAISEWGTRNCIQFNSKKTQFLPISLKRNLNNLQLFFESSPLVPQESINILGVTVRHDLSWKPHIMAIAKTASKKLGILFRFRKYFTSFQLLKLYKGLIRPCLEYCCHIWGNSSSAKLLDAVQRKAIRLISCPELTSNLESLDVRRKVASLSLFYRYYHGHCSHELSDCMPPPLTWSRNTRGAAEAHQYCVSIANPRIERYAVSFFHSTGCLWNELPSHVFPDTYNLSSFKNRVFSHLIHSG